MSNYLSIISLLFLNFVNFKLFKILFTSKIKLVNLVVYSNLINLVISLHHRKTETFSQVESLLVYAFFVNALVALTKIDLKKAAGLLNRKNVRTQGF